MNSTHTITSIDILLILLAIAVIGGFIYLVVTANFMDDPDNHEDDPFMKRPDDKKSIDNKEEG